MLLVTLIYQKLILVIPSHYSIVRLLKRVIEQTVIAVSKHESRPILTGLIFLFRKEN